MKFLSYIFKVSLHIRDYKRYYVILLILFLAYGSWRVAVNPGDFDVYYKTATRVFSAQSLYRPDIDGLNPYKYSPFFAISISPIALLPIKAARSFWFLLTILILFSSVFLVRDLLGVTDNAISFFAVFFTIFFLSRVIFAHLVVGQINLLVLIFIIMGFKLLYNGEEWFSAACFAFAIFAKLTPVLFLAYFIFAGRWRFSFIIVCFMVLFAGAPALIYGINGTISELAAWYGVMTSQHNMFDPENSMFMYNQNLSYILMGFFTDNNLTYLGFKKSIMFFDPQVMQKVFYLFAGFLTFVTFCICRNLKKEKTRMAVVLEMSILCALMMLLSPLAWYHTFVYLIPIYYFVLYCLIKHAYHTPALTRFLFWCNVAMLFVPNFLGGTYGALFDFYSLLGFSTLTMVIALLIEHKKFCILERP